MRRVLIAKPTILRPADAFGDAVTSIVARPLGATATSIGALLAVAWFVAVLGLVSTASGQVVSVLAQRLPTAVRVTAPPSLLPDPPFPYPSDVTQRVDALPGVVATGVWWPVDPARPPVVSASPQVTGQPTGPVRAGAPVIAATPGFLLAASVQISQGRAFDSWDQAHAAQVCLIGSALARSLRLTTIVSGQTIYVDDMACSVSGIVTAAAGQPALTRSVILPAKTALVLFGPPDERAGARPALLIRTRPGAAGSVARLAPYAVSQARPQRFSVSTGTGPRLLQHQVSAALRGLFVILAWFGLAIGILGIAGLTLFCVLQRMPEYALRRALGARRRHIAAHVLCESVMLGLLGGLAGASLGIAVVVLVARAMAWTPVVAPQTLWPAPLVGAVAGMLAGIMPAMRAAWAKPSQGLAKFPPL
jgi:putative ABC transport system permease protein